jgi:hypothetical protein
MRRVVRNVRALHNPVSLSGVGGLAVVRGIAFIATGTEFLPLNGYNNAPSVPGTGIVIVGLVWLFVGAFMWVGMVWRRVFTLSVALMVGMYATWVVLHAVDLFTAPDWDSILALAVYALMVPVTITLAAIEVAPPAEPSTTEVKRE